LVEYFGRKANMGACRRGEVAQVHNAAVVRYPENLGRPKNIILGPGRVIGPPFRAINILVEFKKVGVIYAVSPSLPLGGR
jgi:hypothetical protein